MQKNVQQNNAQNAVLFEAINLVIHLDTETELMLQISTRLGKFISSRETNVRYLGLDAMTHFAARSETLDPIKRHQTVILGSLRDRDISVRRKGLDLIYSMCDTTNSQSIVNELLKYLPGADFAIREEMVLKIAILTEKYATDVQWYVDISLRLIAMAGDHVSDEVWQRVIQIVTNNEELQVYAAQNILEYIKVDECHETLVRIGAYLLGEFGHLIADNKGSSPIEQFIYLHQKLHKVTTATRAMLLTCFVKMVNLFPEIRPQLLQVFQDYSQILDAELQQRACEYLTLANMPSDELLRTICDELPPFAERTSALLSRLHSKHANTSEKRTWVIGGKDANADPKEVFIAQQTGLKRSFTALANGTIDSKSPTASLKSPTDTSGMSSRIPNGTNGTNTVHDLDGLDMNGHSTVPMSPLKTPKATNFATAAHLSAGWERGYESLLFENQGVLYQDAQLQVGLRSEYRAATGVIILYFSNKSSSIMTSFTTTIDNQSAAQIKLDNKSLPDSTIQPGAQSQQTVMLEGKAIFSIPPTIRISYLAGALQGLTLQLPISIHKFMEPAELSSDDFFKRWRQIGGAPREAQRIFGLVSEDRKMTDEFTRTTSRAFHWGLLEGVDPNAKNIVGASVLHMNNGGKFGCLMRLEPNYDTQVSASGPSTLFHFLAL